MTTEEKVKVIQDELNFSPIQKQYISYEQAIDELYDAIQMKYNFFKFSGLLNDPDKKRISKETGLQVQVKIDSLNGYATMFIQIR